MKIFDFLLRKRNPIKYWKKRGAVFGNNCLVVSNASFGSEPYLVKIGDNVKITDYVSFITHDGGIFVVRNLIDDNRIDLIRPIKIGNNVFLGNKVTILPGVIIGDNVIIGYGSIVTKNCKSNAVYAGIPAKYICSIEEYYQKNKDFLVLTKKINRKNKKKTLIKMINEGKLFYK